MKQKTKTNLFVDLLIFVVFLIVYEEKATGTALHEWLGIALGLIFIIHIILHWEWLVAKTSHFFSRMKTESRINYILDMLIYLGFTTIIFTGLMISESFLPTFGFNAVRGHSWQNIHHVSVNITLFLTALHFALHWQWIVKNFRRYLISPLRKRSLTNKFSAQILDSPGKQLSANISKFIKTGYQFLIILALSGLISYGWYTAKGTISADSNFREYHEQSDENRESGFNIADGQRSGQLSSNRRGHHEGRRNHEDGGFFGIEVLKNLFIFSIITLVVTFFNNLIKRKKTSQWMKA